MLNSEDREFSVNVLGENYLKALSRVSLLAYKHVGISVVIHPVAPC